MLGVEPDRFDDFKRWSDGLIAGTTGSTRDDPLASGLAASMRELLLYIQGVIEERRARPRDDLISVLLTAEGEGSLSTFEVAMFVVLLLVAGNETTTNLIGNATSALLQHPEQLARVAADPKLIPNVLEETLRWDSPVQFVLRRTCEDVEVAGTRLPRDQYVVVILGSANRDERQRGPRAGEFDIGRSTQGHLAFGFGNHFCLGASLARLEARVALETLIEHLPHCERSDDRVEQIDSFLLRGPKHLRIRRR
jgi:cytochrome P450